MENDFFRQKKKVFLPVLFVCFVFISVIVIRIFFIPENISVIRRFVMSESTPYNTASNIAPKHTVPTTISSVINFDTQGIEIIQGVSNTNLDIFSNYFHGSVVFAQEYVLGNTDYLDKQIGTVIYTNGTVYMYSNTSHQKFDLNASPVTALWTNKKMVFITEDVYDKKLNKIHLFFYNAKKDFWRHKEINTTFIIGEYKNSYVFDETIFLNTRSGVYVLDNKRVKMYQPNAFVQKFAGTQDFFALQLLHNSSNTKTTSIELYIKNLGKITFMSYSVAAIMPQLISVDMKIENGTPYYNVLFSYAGKTYEARLV